MSTSPRRVLSTGLCCGPRFGGGCRGCGGGRWSVACSRSMACRRRCCGISRNGGSEIEERALELVGADAAGCHGSGCRGSRWRPGARRSTGSTGRTWREQARARAAEHGFGEHEVAVCERPRPARGRTFDQHGWRRASPEREVSPSGTTRSRAATRWRRSRASSRRAPRRRARDHDHQLPPALQVVPIEAPRDEMRYTTVGLLDCERQIVEGARRRAATGCGVVRPSSSKRALADRQPASTLSRLTAVRAVTSSGRGIDTIEALAGTGKTTILASDRRQLPSCRRRE